MAQISNVKGTGPVSVRQSNLNCLLYADDMVLMESKNRVQNCLDAVNEFSQDWNRPTHTKSPCLSVLQNMTDVCMYVYLFSPYQKVTVMARPSVVRPSSVRGPPLNPCSPHPKNELSPNLNLSTISKALCQVFHFFYFIFTIGNMGPSGIRSFK